MSWRAELRPASFRGVPFDIVDLGGTLGRRVVADECPETDILPPTMDLGAVRPSYRIRGFVTGSDYLDRRDQILAALNGYGPGELVHPWRGRLLVQVRQPINYSHDSAGGACVIDFECVDHGGEARPFVELVPESRAAAQVALANADSAAHYGPRGELAGDRVSAELELLDRLVSFGGGVSIGSLLDAEGWDGNGWDETMGLAVSEALESTSDLRGLLAYAAATAAVVWQTVGTPSGEAKRDACEAMTDGMRWPALIRVVALAIGQTYVSADEAERTMSTIAVAISDRLDLIDDHDLYVTILDLRTLLVDSLTVAAERLPREREIEIAAPTPSIVIAFDTYGSRRLAAREAEIVQLNDIGHPGLVAGTIRVLSR